MLPHEELRAEMKRNAKWEVVRDVYSSILRDCDWELVRELGDLQVGIGNSFGDGEDGEEGQRGVRILVVAAGKQDDVEAAREMGRVWREDDHLAREERGGTRTRTRTKSKAAVVRGAVHAWNLQFPEVFAEGIKAWVEGREELPVEYEELV